MNYLHWDINDTDVDAKHLNNEFFATVGIFTAVVLAVLVIGMLL